MALEQDQRISEMVKREQSRLRNSIRQRVPDPRDAEDILQERERFRQRMRERWGFDPSTSESQGQ